MFEQLIIFIADVSFCFVPFLMNYLCVLFAKYLTADRERVYFLENKPRRMFLHKSSLRSALISLKISCVFGASFTLDEKRDFVWDVLRSVHCFVLVLINFYVMIGSDAVNFETKTDFLQIWKIFAGVFTPFFHVFLIVFSYKNRAGMLEMFKKCLKLEERCRKAGIEISWRNLFFYVNGSIIMIIVFDVVQLTALNNSYMSSEKFIYVKCFVLNGFNFVLVQMSAYVCLSNQFLGLIGKELENIEYFKCFVTDFRQSSTWKIREEKLRFIMHTHRNIFDISRGVNSIFSSAILFCVTNSFVTIFTLLFYTWHRFFEEPATYSRNVCCDYIFMIVSILQYSIPLFILCCFCEKTSVEKERIRSIVRDLARNKRNILLQKKVFFHIFLFFFFNIFKNVFFKIIF